LFFSDVQLLILRCECILLDTIIYMFILPGEIISDGEDEEGGDDQFDDEDDYMKKQMAKLDSDKQAILSNNTIIAEVLKSPIHILLFKFQLIYIQNIYLVTWFT